jgi:GAF domain-containing protein
MVTGYVLGLAPPRRLLRSWQRTELVRFLVRTAERPPDERADVLAEELLGAATRSVTAVTTAVLLGRDTLATHASSEPAWEGLSVSPASGLVGIALGGAEPVVGEREEAEPPLNRLAEGDVVTIVPIVRSSPPWGVLVFVQRRTSLYLPDDLFQLGTLCRHAADILDHARLAHQERERQEAPEAVSAG